MKIILEIEDNKQGKALINFLNQLPFVKLTVSRKRRKTNLEDIFGLWKNRDISKEELRKNAWRW